MKNTCIVNCADNHRGLLHFVHWAYFVTKYYCHWHYHNIFSFNKENQTEIHVKWVSNSEVSKVWTESNTIVLMVCDRLILYWKITFVKCGNFKLKIEWNLNWWHLDFSFEMKNPIGENYWSKRTAKVLLTNQAMQYSRYDRRWHKYKTKSSLDWSSPVWHESIMFTGLDDSGSKWTHIVLLGG